MSKKLLQEDCIKRFIDKHGTTYDYSYVIYKSDKIPVDILCNIHGIFSQSPAKHWGGQGCRKCGFANSGLKKRKDSDEVFKKALEVHGGRYGYKNSIYEGMHKKILVTCFVDGHGDFPVTAYLHVNNKQGCPKCFGKNKTTEEIIAEANLVHNNFYLYPRAIYTKKHKNFIVTCPIEGHGDFPIKPIKHINGKQGCPKCRYIKSSSKSRHSLENVAAKLTKIHNGKYEYPGPYINSCSHMPIICPEHGVFKQSPSVHKNNGCPECSGMKKKTTEVFINSAINIHGDLYDYSVSVYNGIFEKLDIICKDHGLFHQTAKDHLEGCGCPHCPTVVSKPEKTLSSFIESLGFSVQIDLKLNNDRNFRYDSVLDKNKLIFEFNGCYWHSYPRKEPMYHVNKRRYAEASGYTMFSIWEDDWEFKKEKIKFLIERKLLVNSEKIYARKTKVIKLERNFVIDFHEKYHIQDFKISAANEHYALQYNEKIIAVASFDKSGTLHRYTIQTGISIHGGLTKLISAFRKDHGNMAITTYCDRDYFDGSLYKACGFEKVSETKQLSYFYKNKRVRREKFMKYKLPSMFGDVDLTKREVDICADNGVYACYNSGVEKWVLP